MEVQELVNLFDSHWFQHEILKPKTPFSQISKTSPILESNEPLAKLSRTPTFLVRSQSDHCLSSKDCLISENSNTPSPKSVLGAEPKLQPILSGKEYNESQFSAEPSKEVVKNTKENYRRRKKKSNNSKSLSELEFEELKGFMDLGFMFSDKDKESSLVTILPGLRRLGKENEGFEEASVVSRPHLSEAWDVWEEKKKMERNNPLKSWKINPGFGNEMDIKDQLKYWAHTVASTVR